MPQGEPNSLASLVRRYRLVAGLSQEELAERSGLSARAISDIERGLSLAPRPETIRMLAEGLGLSAGERTSLIVAAHPELRAMPGESPPEEASLFGRPADQLPDAPAELIGREAEVAELAARVTQHATRLITLTGPGGVGKTRLALEVANRVSAAFPGGAVFVDLAPVSNPGLVASAIAQTLGVPETGGRSPERALGNALAARPPMLVVLDNFEQVIEAAQLVRVLLDAAPRLTMLVTSREALRVHGEDEFEIQPLDVPSVGVPTDVGLIAGSPAVSLFVRSASAAKHGFFLTDLEAELVAEICRRLDGLPLAIELAATRVRHFPPDVLLRHLEPRLSLLTDGARDRPARQRTMRNTIAWSYDLLDPAEQALLRQLGVFVGGTSLEAAEAVASNHANVEIDVLTALSSLVDKHLVRKRMLPDGALRFSMLEVVREFAIEQLQQTNEYQQARNIHAGHFLDLVEATGVTWTTHLHGFPGQELITHELDNIRSAMSWFGEQRDAEKLARMVDSIWGYYYVHGHFREACTLGEHVLDLAGDRPLPVALQASMLGTLSTMVSVLGNSERAVALAKQSLARSRQVPSEPGLVPLSLISVAIALRDAHQFAEARQYAEQALTASRVWGVDEFVEPHVLYHIGRLAYLQHDLDRAASFLTESLELIRRLGSTETALYTINTLAEVRLKQGNLGEAAGLLREGRLFLNPGGYTGLWFDAVVLLAAKCRLPDHAARMLGCYSAYYASLGIGEAYVDPSLEAEIESLLDEVGGSHFDAEYRAGAAMTMADAMDIALQVLDQAEAAAPGPHAA